MSFTIGMSQPVEDKMDMSLDQIIKTERKPRRERITNSPTAKPLQSRNKQNANKAAARSTNKRQGGVQSMRGIESSPQQKPKEQRATSAVRNGSDWLKQQRMRKQESEKRLNKYKTATGSTNFTNNTNNTNNARQTNGNSSNGPSFTIKLNSTSSQNSNSFSFDAPSFLGNQNNARTTRGNDRANNRQQRGNVKNVTVNVVNDRLGPQRSRQNTQQRQSIAVNALRGVTMNADAEKPSSLNDRFGASRKPTNVTSNGNNRNSGRTVVTGLGGGGNNGRNNNNRRNVGGNNNVGGRSVIF